MLFEHENPGHIGTAIGPDADIDTSTALIIENRTNNAADSNTSTDIDFETDLGIEMDIDICMHIDTDLNAYIEIVSNTEIGLLVWIWILVR